MSLTDHFYRFREHIIGQSHDYSESSHNSNILYADWTASGRLYRPIEDFISHELGPYVANTHTETTLTGTTMTEAYHDAQRIIKQHVNAYDSDVLIAAGSGMTLVINKFQRMLGLRVPEKWRERLQIAEHEKPLVLVTHMEHHSNQVSWMETMADIVIVPPGEDLMPCPDKLDELLGNYKDRTLKIGAFTACSNVTGEMTDHKGLAKTMHAHGGICFFDFAASAPYVDIDIC